MSKKRQAGQTATVDPLTEAEERELRGLPIDIRRVWATLDAERAARAKLIDAAVTRALVEAHREAEAQCELLKGLLRRWVARGFPMGGAPLWDDTKAALADETSADRSEEAGR